MSADPLEVQVPGEADPNVYAYVSGQALQSTDPLGLQESSFTAELRKLGDSTPPAPSGVSSHDGVTVQHRGGGLHDSSEVEIKAADPRAAPEATPSRAGSRPGEEVLSLLGHVGISAAPGVGEAMDLETLTDPKATTFERGAAIASLAVSGLSYGVLPNFGAIRRGLGLHRAVESTEATARGLTRGEAIVERPVARAQSAAADAVVDQRAGKSFTRAGKEQVKTENAAAHGGQTTCKQCGRATVPGQQGKSGVTPPGNETHVDHVKAKSKGGSGLPPNGQVLCRDCNLKKGAK